MSKGLKILLGFLSFSPIILFLFLPSVFDEYKPVSTSREEMETFHDMFKLVLIIMWFWCISLIIGFSKYALKSSFVPEQKRKLWVAVIVFGNFIVFPFFWYWYMWKNNNDVSKN